MIDKQNERLYNVKMDGQTVGQLDCKAVRQFNKQIVGQIYVQMAWEIVNLIYMLNHLKYSYHKTNIGGITKLFRPGFSKTLVLVNTESGLNIIEHLFFKTTLKP